MIENLSTSFSLYQEYEKLLGSNKRFQEALAEVYFDTLVFLQKAKIVFTTKGFGNEPPWLRSVMKG